VRPYRVSLFMQRAMLAQVANDILPFAAVTSEMPVTLIGPTLLVDPMFVNLGRKAAGGPTEGQTQQQQPQQPQPQPQQPAQPQQPQQVPQTQTQTQTQPAPVQPQPQPQPQLQQSSPQFQSPHQSLQQSSFQSPQQSSGHFSSYAQRRSHSQSAVRGRGQGRRRTDADVDLLYARMFGVTPAETQIAFQPNSQALFAAGADAPRAQAVRFFKAEDGVKIRVREGNRE
jgi:outer membrane biosynthesis protein TonB